MGNKRDTDEDNDVQECIRTLNVVIQKGTIDAKLKVLRIPGLEQFRNPRSNVQCSSGGSTPIKHTCIQLAWAAGDDRNEAYTVSRMTSKRVYGSGVFEPTEA